MVTRTDVGDGRRQLQAAVLGLDWAVAAESRGMFALARSLTAAAAAIWRKYVVCIHALCALR